MLNKIIFSFLCSIFIVTNVKAKVRKHSENKQLDNENKSNKNEEEKKEINETDKITKHNEKHEKQRFIKSKEEEIENIEDEKKKEELLKSQKIEEEKIKKEKDTGKLLAVGISGDELVGAEFVKWSTVKAKTTSKEFKKMYLENLKMKKILKRIYDKQKGNNKEVTKVQTEEKIVKNQEEEIFFIYGNYEDEEGELSGDAYLKWSGIKAKTTAKQFKSLIQRNKFLQLKIQRIMNENRRLTNEIGVLKVRNKRLLRG